MFSPIRKGKTAVNNDQSKGSAEDVNCSRHDKLGRSFINMASKPINIRYITTGSQPN